MNVGQLKKMLEHYPENLEVIIDRHSDYELATSLDIVEGVPKDFWIMRAHDFRMSEENQLNRRKYLYISSN